jgi:inorganic pyrophosphatase
MKIAVYSNSRTAYMAIDSLSEAFVVAFRAGCVMGFSLCGLGLLVLTIIIAIYRSIYGNIDT